MFERAYAQQTEDAYRKSYGEPKAQLVQPADPLTDRIRRALADIGEIVSATECDLGSVSERLFGACERDDYPDDPNALPVSAEQAIERALYALRATAQRARQLAAELNGRL